MIGLGLLLSGPARAQELPPTPDEIPALTEGDGPGRDRPQRGEKRGERDGREGRGDHLRKNFQKWREMSPEDREAMRQLHARRREEVRQEIAKAVERSGLQLTDGQKERFRTRYREERRKLEEEIRREMDEQRRQRLPGMMDKLRAEFADEAVSAEPSPAPSPDGSEPAE